MLEICGLTKYFSGIPAVQDVSFTLKPGAAGCARNAGGLRGNRRSGAELRRT